MSCSGFTSGAETEVAPAAETRALQTSHKTCGAQPGLRPRGGESGRLAESRGESGRLAEIKGLYAVEFSSEDGPLRDHPVVKAACSGEAKELQEVEAETFHVGSRPVAAPAASVLAGAVARARSQGPA